MKTYIIDVDKCFMVDGKIRHHTFQTKVSNVKKFFAQRIEDAEVFAVLQKSEVKPAVSLAPKSLYINYSTIPGIDLVDVLYLAQ